MHLGSLTRISWIRYCQTYSYQIELFALNLQQYQIDYVAHDEDPYVSGNHDDVYAFVKNQGVCPPRFSSNTISDCGERSMKANSYRPVVRPACRPQSCLSGL